MASFICLVRNVIVFFHGYAYEGYYENNVDRCFNYQSGYEDNDTVWSGLLGFHPGGVRLCLYPNGQPETTLFGG